MVALSHKWLRQVLQDRGVHAPPESACAAFVASLDETARASARAALDSIARGVETSQTLDELLGAIDAAGRRADESTSPAKQLCVSEVTTVYVLVSGAVWSLGWSASGKPWRKALAVVVAWIVALLPPVSLGVAGHPVIAWGTILPGSGWVGVGLSVLGPATMVWLVARHRPSAKSQAAVLALLGAALCTIGFARFESPSRATPAAVGVTTEWGQNVSVDGILQRVASMGEVTRTLATQEAPTTVVWPESIIGTYNPALYPVLNIEVLSVARASGQTHIIGMDLVGDGNRYENAAVAFYPDGRTARAVARQPAPVSLWKPWRKTDTFVADWSANNVLTIGATRRAAFIFCYEEYMPFFYLLNELQGPVDLYVAMANTWAAESPEAAEIQTQHSFGMARLFGRPYIKAENRPLPSSKN